MNRDQILRLQRELISQGYLNPGDDDGAYGQKTRDAEARRNSDLQARQSQTQQTNAEANKTNAAAALAAAQAEQARATAEAAKINQQTEAGRQAQQASQKKQQEIEAYQNSPEGFNLGLAKNVGAPLAGLGFGMLEAAAPRAIETRIGNSRNAQRAALGNQAGAIDFSNPSEAIPRAQAIAAEARANNLLPSGTASSRVGPFLGRLAPGILVGAPLIGEGLYQRFVGANDPNNTPANRDELLALSNFLTAGGFGTLAGAGRYAAAGPATVPDSEAISKIRQAEARANLLQSAQNQAAKQPSNALATRAQPDMINALASYKAQQPASNALTLQAEPPQQALPAPEPQPTAPEVTPPADAAQNPNRYRGTHADVVRNIASDFGIAPSETKGRTAQNLLSHIDNADTQTLRSIAARVPGVDETGSNKAIRQGLKDFLSDIGSRGGRLTSVLGPAGAMLAGGLALGAGSDDAYAGPRRDESIPEYRARQVGNALYGAGQGALEAAPYLIPGVGEALTVRDLANLDSEAPPSNLTLKNALAAGQNLVGARNIEAAKADQARQIYEAQHPRMSDAALFPGMTQTPEATQNSLALNGPDGKFYRALQDFQNHFAALKAAGAQANQ